MKDCMEECEREQKIRPSLTIEEKQEILKRKIDKIRINEAIRKAHETRGRERFAPVILPSNMPKDLFADENEKSGHQKLTEIMEKTERGMEFTRLMELIKKLEREENE